MMTRCRASSTSASRPTWPNGARQSKSACSEHPQHAAELRLRFGALKSAGLVGDFEESTIDRFPADSGSTFGGFELLRILGQGGMGVVYLARQLSTGREVALKLIRPELLGQRRARQRFQREIEAVSQVDDPGICTVYEAGEVEGTPYVAMRYVNGSTLVDANESLFASDGTNTNQFGSQSNYKKRSENVLAVFEKIARALHAAHEAGFLHRDVKPGNIMIDEQGEPVVLDFGLARPEQDTGEGLTASADQLGTPAYMSPEQVQGKSISLDRRSDIYSLGVTMYECLAGRHPFEAPTREVLYQNILAGQAAQLGSNVPRDVSVIVQTAMALSPDHRYDTAGAFADDLRRARLLEPIRARRPSTFERAMRWSQRQPVIAGLIAALLLVAGVSVWLAIDADESRIAAEQQRIVAEQQRIVAEQQADTRGRVSRFLVDLFRIADGQTYRGQTITAREVLDLGFRDIQTGLTEEPAIRSQLMVTMGEVYHHLGIMDRSTTLLEQAQELLRKHGGEPELRASVQHTLAVGAYNRQDYEAAEDHCQQSLAILSAAGLNQGAMTAGVYDLQAKLRSFTGDYEEAEQLLDRCFAIRQSLGSNLVNRIRHLQNLGQLAIERGDNELAVKEIGSAIDAYEAGGSPNYAIAQLWSMLSEGYVALGNVDKAKEAIDKAMTITRESLGDDHPTMGQRLSRLGQIAAASGDIEQAITYHTEARRILSKFLGPESAAVATQMCMLGSLQIDARDFGKAKQLLEGALTIRRKVFDNKGAPLGRCLVFLGELSGMQGQHEPAIKRFREAYAKLSEALGDEHPDTQIAIQYLTMHLQATKSPEAEEWRTKINNK